MGLTSSQGRLLMLTSRLSDIQLDEILISQRQNQLAWQSEKVAKEYNEKISNTKLIMKVNNADSLQGYTKEDLSYDNLTSMGYLITDVNSEKLYLTFDNDGKPIVPKSNKLADENMFDGDIYEEDGKQKIKLKNSDKVFEIVDGTALISDKRKLQNNLTNGVLFVLNTTGNDTHGTALNQLEANTSIEWVQDTSDDAEAESKYNYETARIAHQDNELDLEMKQLETQHNAVIKELESVQKVIEDNIERTFKLFEGG